MSERILQKDSEWSTIDGEPCRVIDFLPTATIQDGQISAPNGTEPYASVVLECKKLPQNTRGLITHKMDFQHLWNAFRERGVGENEEAIIFWSKKHLRRHAKLFSTFMPKLWVMVCPRGAFELMSDPNYKPELSGEARWDAERPIAEWKPEVMK